MPLKINDICFIREFITLKVMISNKQYNIVDIYRSPSQNQEEFDSFLKNIEITLDKVALDNTFMLAVIGGLNSK